jgi:hypothetical protein
MARKATARKATSRRTTRKNTRRTRGNGTAKRWSAKVMQRSDALDLEPSVFRGKSAHGIALSLKRSAERSKRRKAGPYQSAMSMLNFYINRGGRNLSASRKKVLNQAKQELRAVFGRA